LVSGTTCALAFDLVKEVTPQGRAMLPDKRQFDDDVSSAEFRAGVLKGEWGLIATDMEATTSTWPQVSFWIAAAPRPNSPDQFYVALNAAGYPTAPPTGTFWDPENGSILAFDRRPKGRSETRVAKVFRTGWEGGRAFYHPYDRVAAQGHPGWLSEQPLRVWSPAHTIVDWLEEFRGLLQSGDYLGV